MMASGSGADPFTDQLLPQAQQAGPTAGGSAAASSVAASAGVAHGHDSGEPPSLLESSGMIGDDDTDWVSFDDESGSANLDAGSVRQMLVRIVKQLDNLSSHILVLHKTILQTQVTPTPLSIVQPLGSAPPGYVGASLGHTYRTVVKSVSEQLLTLRDENSLSQHDVNLLMFSPTLTRSGSDPMPNLMLTYLFIKLAIPPNIELEQCKEITKKIQYSWKKVRAEEITLGHVQRPTVVPSSIRLQGGRPMVFHFRHALDSLARRELTPESSLLAYCNRILRELRSTTDLDQHPPVTQQPTPGLDQQVYGDPIFNSTPASPSLFSENPIESAKRMAPEDHSAAAMKRPVRQRKD